MKKFSKKITAILGTATLAIGLMALPALAGTTQQQSSGWGQMQNFMQQAFNNQSSVPSSSNASSTYGYRMMGGFAGLNGNGGYGMMGGYSGTNTNSGYGMMGAW
ncbi:exported hypothetical protein [Candidatus Desulfosporosinus infrequens]|uniref:Uncharacterized protein n=1 Tax=Candidatus Desulfosporosinus infrequens TaxID=2043169 RepID=A0A2U3LN93_9FIRM|nr:exported hypothetical protein [Candidatus Desulfosporosinus infrequens]